MKDGDRPTGIIRTLPYFGAGGTGDGKKDAMGRAYRRMMKAFKGLARGDNGQILIAMGQKPTQDVLHCYILVGGEIRVRANIASFEPSDSIGGLHCWDDTTRNPKWIAVLTSPVSFPPAPIARKGFQGFRYTQDLW